ncbi:alpha-1,6-mannosyl-glycoprotein 2-beta-N-acetylglucosaminyltransferase-like, partial [Drosophila navojoa]|uniref:alpha-1,6-mannosyl-glycoprotein 2-beta-N-acetylglucosaminyltransferase-like n=1 Tax=Drosophila navojoa TaxID=7232 RepID=UPI0011BE5021
LVLFLEEEDIVAEDFLFVLYKMQKSAKKLCAHCNIFSLGGNLSSLKVNSKRDDNAYSKVQYAAWSSEEHAVAVAFNASTWSEILSCAQDFCTYDDCNWDKSLQHIGETCIKGGLNVLTVKKPRVYSTRNCSYLSMSKANFELGSASKLGQLYPATLKLSSSILKAATKPPIEVMK